MTCQKTIALNLTISAGSIVVPKIMSITIPRASSFVTRSAAGLVPRRSVSRNITPGNGGVAVHYGGANVPVRSATHARQIWGSWQRYHMSPGWSGTANGAADVAYNYAVDNWGNVYEGRGVGVRSAGQGSNYGNQNYYAVVWIGGAAQTPTPAALSAMAWIIHELRTHGGAGLRVRPHSDFNSTGCPGNDWRREIKRIDGKTLRGSSPKPPAAPGWEEDMDDKQVKVLKDLADRVLELESSGYGLASHAITDARNISQAGWSQADYEFFAELRREFGKNNIGTTSLTHVVNAYRRLTEATGYAGNNPVAAVNDLLRKAGYGA